MASLTLSALWISQDSEGKVVCEFQLTPKVMIWYGCLDHWIPFFLQVLDVEFSFLIFLQLGERDRDCQHHPRFLWSATDNLSVKTTDNFLTVSLFLESCNPCRPKKNECSIRAVNGLRLEEPGGNWQGSPYPNSSSSRRQVCRFLSLQPFLPSDHLQMANNE